MKRLIWLIELFCMDHRRPEVWGQLDEVLQNPYDTEDEEA